MSETDNKVIDRKFNCPVCFEDFTSPRARMTKIRLYGTDEDLRPYYEGLDVVCYEIICCPHCGYSAIEKTFMNVTDGTREAIRTFCKEKNMAKQWPHYLDTNNAIERFVFAILCATPKKAKTSELSYLYLKLSWLYRVNEGNPKREDNEIFCQKKFVELGEKTFAEENFPVLDIDYTTYLYLIAEVSRRLKDFHKAYKYIGKVILDKNTTPKLKQRAIDVKELIVEDRKAFCKEHGLDIKEYMLQEK